MAVAARESCREKSNGEIPGALFVNGLGVGRLLGVLLAGFLGKGPSTKRNSIFVLYQISFSARLLVRFLRFVGVPITLEELEFDFIDDVRIPGIADPLSYIYYSAAPELLDRVESDPQYGSSISRYVRQSSHQAYACTYISKRIFFEIIEDLRSVLTVAWYSQQKLESSDSPVVLYLRKSCYFGCLSAYASRWNIQLRPLRGWAIPWRGLVRQVRDYLKAPCLRLLNLCRGKKSLESSLPGTKAAVRIAAEMYFNGVTLNPIYNTEFFWYRKASLPDWTVFGYFRSPLDQPTGQRQIRLKDAGIGWIDRATVLRLMHDGQASFSLPRSVPGAQAGESEIEGAVCTYMQNFYSDYERWHRFFAATGTRIHISTYDIFPSSEALHAALADLGGVSVSIQRSIEREPYTVRRTVTDAHFAFSPAQADLECLSGSSVEQFVAAGYLFDDAFPAAKKHAQQLVSSLRSRGITFIISFFDENHGVVPKKIGGRRLVQRDYAFLCDQLAADETLGLILKPKRPETLPARLGAVWDRVQELVDSGRCIFMSNESWDDRFLPCVAASASDLAVSTLSGGTAGLESYLSGTRTLLLRHGTDLGVFKRLPEGCVVFDHWEDLWRAVERFRANPSDAQIGNWGPIIEQFASLRDGCASKRISSYILWLYKAFEMGKSREEALSYAASFYVATWGKDLITRISPASLWNNDAAAREFPSACMPIQPNEISSL